MINQYIIEARDEKGRLKFDCEQPPVKDFSEDNLYKLYWQLSQDKSKSVSKETALEFFKTKHWYVRRKTW